jgi:hypothetical protein
MMDAQLLVAEIVNEAREDRLDELTSGLVYNSRSG